MTRDWFGFVSFSKRNVSEAELLRVPLHFIPKGEERLTNMYEVKRFCLKVAYQVKHAMLDSRMRTLFNKKKKVAKLDRQATSKNAHTSLYSMRKIVCEKSSMSKFTV